ncbi:MAG: MBL fold metallo-hydrolase [Lewinellaceae bacterium]|nr:MBL fold metallo-hydrolase [Lewinellaceae bacterium]
MKWIGLALLLSSYSPKPALNAPEVELIILGVAQDGGYPHIGCRKACCERYYSGQEARKTVVALGIIDHVNEQVYLIEATPDLPEQWRTLLQTAAFPDKKTPDGIFITHAHIGHYSGLMYLGREALGAHQVPVYGLPRMLDFLEKNGPWSQLCQLQNIALHPIFPDSAVVLNDQVKITPFLVPHRDEYSETAGFLIEGPNKKVLFIPDIDKWEKWNRPLDTVLEQVDYALLDATFFRDGELPGRSMKEVPHPFVAETMTLLSEESPELRSKVLFIHMNHSNPLLWDQQSREAVETAGFGVAKAGMHITL